MQNFPKKLLGVVCELCEIECFQAGGSCCVRGKGVVESFSQHGWWALGNYRVSGVLGRWGRVLSLKQVAMQQGCVGCFAIFFAMWWFLCKWVLTFA